MQQFNILREFLYSDAFSFLCIVAIILKVCISLISDVYLEIFQNITVNFFLPRIIVYKYILDIWGEKRLFKLASGGYDYFNLIDVHLDLIRYPTGLYHCILITYTDCESDIS